MVKSNAKKEAKAKTNSKARSKTKAKTVSKAKSTSKAKSDKNTTNKWGFLAPTREKAKEMEAKYGVHFTPLIDYMKVIFPDIDDWEEDELINTGLEYNEKEEFIKPHLSSDTRHMVINLGESVDIYDEYGIGTSYTTYISNYDHGNYEVYCIDEYTQLTNATVKQIFGIDVAEPLFDETKDTISQKWVHISPSRKRAEDFLKGKYIGDEKQYKINFEAYNKLMSVYWSFGISKIIVEKLFDLYSYEIKLNTDRDIAILIGPNGCGKTTILKIVRFMLSGIGKNEIMKIPFKSVTCELTSGKKIKLEGNKISDFQTSGCFDTEFISAQRLFHQINDKKDNIEAEDESVHQYSETILEIKKHFEKFCEEARKKYNEGKAIAEHWLFDDFVMHGLDGHNVLENSSFEKEWKEFSETRWLYEHNKALNYLYDYNHDYIYECDGEVIENDEIVMKQYTREYKRNNRGMKEFLCVYLRQFKRALMWLKEPHEKTMLFQRIINDRFKITQKQLNYRFGSMYLTIGKDKNKKEIPLEALSSGEKNDFIMFYNLIFNCNDCKIFVDEPEISLHIEWQERYIDDLSEICEMNNIQALVATHSPNIIYDHTDLIANWEIKDE